MLALRPEASVGIMRKQPDVNGGAGQDLSPNFTDRLFLSGHNRSTEASLRTWPQRQVERLTMTALQRIAAILMTFGATTLGSSNEAWGARAADASPDQIAGKTYRLERVYLICVHVPIDFVDKVRQSLNEAVVLDYGNYDQVAYVDAEALEYYRPTAGSKAGVQQYATATESKVLTVSLIHDATVLQKALDAIHKVHPYEEPVIYITEGWRSRSTSSDEHNPNRWWNQKPK